MTEVNDSEDMVRIFLCFHFFLGDNSIMKHPLLGYWMQYAFKYLYFITKSFEYE